MARPKKHKTEEARKRANLNSSKKYYWLHSEEIKRKQREAYHRQKSNKITEFFDYTDE